MYALAKQIQWIWPNSLGEDHFVLILGGLHMQHRDGNFKGTYMHTHIIIISYLHLVKVSTDDGIKSI